MMLTQGQFGDCSGALTVSHDLPRLTELWGHHVCSSERLWGSDSDSLFFSLETTVTSMNPQSLCHLTRIRSGHFQKQNEQPHIDFPITGILIFKISILVHCGAVYEALIHSASCTSPSLPHKHMDNGDVGEPPPPPPPPDSQWAKRQQLR